MGAKRTTVYLKDDVKKLLDNVSFLTKISKVDLVNDALLNHLESIIESKNLKEKLKLLD